MEFHFFLKFVIFTRCTWNKRNISKQRKSNTTIVWDHTNIVPTRKDFRRSTDLSNISQFQCILVLCHYFRFFILVLVSSWNKAGKHVSLDYAILAYLINSPKPYFIGNICKLPHTLWYIRKILFNSCKNMQKYVGN